MSGSSAVESQGQLGSLVERQKHWQWMSGSSATGVRIVSSRRQDRYPKCQERYRGCQDRYPKGQDR